MIINTTDREKLNQLKTTDVYSMLLFILFKLKGNPEYSTLSELAYLADYNSILNILEYFGGLTIKIPTMETFKQVLNALIIFEKVNIDGEDYTTVLKGLAKSKAELSEIEETYIKVCEIVNSYDFRRQQ